MAAGTYSAGTAFLQIVPSFLGIDAATKQEAAKVAQTFERAIATALPKGMEEGAKSAKAEGSKAGEEWGGAYASAVEKRLRAAFTSLPKARPDVELGPFDAKIAEMRARLESLHDAHIKAQLDDTVFLAELELLRRELRSMQNEAPHFDQFINLQAAAEQVEALNAMVEEARRKGFDAGSAYGGAFATRARTEIDAVLKSLPKINMEANPSEAEFAIATIRAQLEELQRMSVSVNMDDREFLTKLTEVRAALAELGLQDNKIGLDFDLEAARERLRRYAESIGKEQGRQTGENFAGAFRDAALPRLEAALKALPSVDLNANPDPAMRAIGVLRAELQTVKDAHVNAELDDAEFLAKLRYLQAQLEDLARNATTAEIKFNADKAAAEIRTFADSVAPMEAAKAGDRAGGAFDAAFTSKIEAALRNLPRIEINADTSDADLALAHVRGEIEALHTAHINAEVDDATAMAQLEALKLRLDVLARESPSVRVRAEAAAASAELVAVLALAREVDRSDPTVRVKEDGSASGLVKSLQEMSAAAGLSHSQIAFVLTLGASLGSVIVPAAAAAAAAIGAIGTAAGAAAGGIGVAILGFSGISTAVQALDKYQQQTAKSAASLETSQNRVAGSLDSVGSAERSLANTREQVAYANERAAQTVRDAQQSVTDAEKQALQARQALTQAYEDARRAEEDQALAMRSNALAQRQANLDIAKAKADLDAVLANPQATAAEREQARITYEQQVLQLDDLKTKQQRMQEDKAKADKAGIAGSAQVQAAQQKVQQATDNIAKAQQNLANAIKSQQEQQRQGAFQVVQAQQAVINAQRQVEQATTQAGVAGGAALQNLNVAMANLGPVGQRFARFVVGLKGDFLSLRDAAQTGMLPGLERGIEGLLPYVAQLQRWITNIAGSLGSMFEDLPRQLQLPTWKAFFGYIENTTVPTLNGMYRFATTAARGLAALFLALTPFNHQIGGGLIQLAEGFARWAENLQSSTGYQKFLAYVRENGPHVVDLLKQMGIFIAHIVEAAAPIGATIVRIFESLFATINSWPIGTMTNILRVLGALATLILAATVALKFLKGAMSIKDAFETFSKAWDKASTKVKGWAASVRGATNELQVFGSATRGAQNATEGLNTNFMFFEGMSGRILTGARNAMAGYTAAVTTATGQVGLLARAQELAGAAMGRFITGPATAAVERYQEAVTTATGQVGLLARAQELAGAAVERFITVPASAVVERYQEAVTTATGKVSLFGRAAEVAYMEVLRAAGLLSAAQERVSATASQMATLPSAALARYTTAVTTATGEVGLLARAQELAGMAANTMSTTAQTALTRYREAVTTTSGEVGLLARAQEVLGNVASQAAAFASAAMQRFTGTITAAITETGVLTAAQRAFGATAAASSTLGSNVMSGLGSAAGAAAVKADGLIFRVGTGLSGAVGLATRGLGSLVGMLGGPVGIALAGASLGFEYFQKQAAESKARVDQLSNALQSYADTMKGGLTPAAIEQAQAALQQDKALQGLVQTTRAAGIDNATLVRGINGEKGARDEVIAAINQEIADEKKRADATFGISDLLGKREHAEHVQRIQELTEQRIAFAKRNTENAALGKITEDLTKELNVEKQMVDDVGKAFNDSGADATVFKTAISEVSSSSVDANLRLQTLDAITAKVSASNLDGSTKAGLFRNALDAIGQATDLHGPTFQALSGMFDTIAGSAIGAKDKTDLLKQSLDLLYGAAQQQINAQDAMVKSQSDLQVQMAQSKLGFDVTTASTADQTQEIERNRDALKAAAQAIQEKYVQDVVEAQNSDNVALAVERARKSHDDAIVSLKNSIDPAHREQAAVQQIVDTFGGIPKNVSPKYTTDDSFTTLYNQLRQVAFMQQQIKEGASPERAQALWNQQEQMRKGIFGPYYIPPKADGGLLEGPWKGPKADNLLIRANPREFIHQVAAVDYYGVAFMDALNKRLIPKWALPGFADGGLAGLPRFAQGGSVTWPFEVNLAGSWSPSLQQALDVIGYHPGGSAGPGQLGDWIRSALMYAHVPDSWGGPLRVLVMRESGGRPDAVNNWDINAQRGTPSIGLAQVIKPTFEQYRDPHLPDSQYDPVANLVAALNYIKGRYGSIFNVQQADPNRPPMGYSLGGLVRWQPKLYDDGGVLQPGWNPPIYNGTGQPEPVLNAQQWNDINAAARGGQTAGGNTYVFPFRDTTLTESKLRALQAADALRARVGRRR